MIGAVVFMAVSSCSMHRIYTDSNSNAYVDLVCRMAVEPDSALKYIYQESTYYFDSEESLSVFQKNPEKFSRNRKSNTLMWLSNPGWLGPVMAEIMVIGMTSALLLRLNH